MVGEYLAREHFSTLFNFNILRADWGVTPSDGVLLPNW
jgi:hypothetical protein